jgi:hypothetical protein
MSITIKEKLTELFSNNGIENVDINIINEPVYTINNKIEIEISFLEDVIIDNDCIEELEKFNEKNNCFFKIKKAKNYSIFLKENVKPVMMREITPFEANDFRIFGSNNSNNMNLLYYPINCNIVSIKNSSYLTLSPVLLEKNKKSHINHFTVNAYSVNEDSIFPESCDSFSLSNKEDTEDTKELKLTFDSLNQLNLKNVKLSSLTVDTPLKSLNLESCILSVTSLKPIKDCFLMDTKAKQEICLTLTNSLRTDTKFNDIYFNGKVNELHLLDGVTRRNKEHYMEAIKIFTEKNINMNIESLTYFFDPLILDSKIEVNEQEKIDVITLLEKLNVSKIHFLDRLKEIKKIVVMPPPEGVFKRKLLL